MLCVNSRNQSCVASCSCKNRWIWSSAACLCAGERAGTTGASVLKYWESTEETDHKASVCADLCGDVWVDQSESFRLLWGRCTRWSSSGFHTECASLHPAILACHGDLGMSPPLSLGQPSGDLSNVCRQSSLAARIDARTADRPAVSP